LALLALLNVASAGSAQSAAGMPPDRQLVDAGSTWLVDHTTQLKQLNIGSNAKLSAPAGSVLTLTVNGIGTPIQPGTYQGKVVLTVSKPYMVPFSGFDPYPYHAAVMVVNGKYAADQSVAAVVSGGTVSDNAADNVSIDSRESLFNGIVVTGDSTYTVNNARINLTGNGGNDFAGYGAAIMSSGNAKLTINKARIKTTGAIRTALFIGGNSTMIVNDSFIEVFNGVLPADYVFSIQPGKMMEVPYGLGITGNVRATNLIDTGTVYYNHVHVRAHGWGALSSDGNGPTRMQVKDSLIETIESGYGAYANGNAHDHFSNTRFNVADVALIMGGPGSGTFTDGSVVNSGKVGMFMHQGSGGSVLTIDKKSVINTRQAMLQIKGRGGDVIIDDATINAGNGIIVQSMDNDDPIMRDMAAGRGGGGPPGGDMPGSEAAAASPNVNASFRNVSLRGDVYHARTMPSDMTVTLQNATLTGAISTSVASPLSGVETSRATFKTIGEVKNTVGHSARGNALRVSLGVGSKWVVNKSSYLTGLTIAVGASVQAAKGHSITMSVNGVVTAINAGTYGGKIVLQVGT
jgi:hypothetical protein